MKTISLNDIEAQALIFGFGNRQLVVTAERLDTLKFWEVYGHDAEQISHKNFYDDGDGSWFVFYVADCFDPPKAVIRARSFETAYEIFCDEFSDWMKIDDSDLPDYIECSECGGHPTVAEIPTLDWSDGQPVCRNIVPRQCNGHYEDRSNRSGSGVAIDSDAAQGEEITLLRIVVNTAE
jgi:hypothetical protein